MMVCVWICASAEVNVQWVIFGKLSISHQIISLCRETLTPLLPLLKYLSERWQIIWFLFKAAELIIPLDYRMVKLCLFSGVSYRLAAGLSLSLKTAAEREPYSSVLHIEFWDVSSTPFPPSSGLLRHLWKHCFAFCSESRLHWGRFSSVSWSICSTLWSRAWFWKCLVIVHEPLKLQWNAGFMFGPWSEILWLLANFPLTESPKLRSMQKDLMFVVSVLDTFWIGHPELKL